MAIYHFRIKSDKRANGASTNAVSHVKYINREDEYANVDSRQELAAQRFTENTISFDAGTSEIKNMSLLYESPYGSIIGNDNAICVSDSPTPATIDIALMYAYKQHDGVLNVSGSNEFKEQIILCAADLNLPIKFTDKEMQSVFDNLKGDYLNGHRKSNGRIDSDDRTTGNRTTAGGAFQDTQYDFPGSAGAFADGNGAAEADNIYESDTELFASEASSSIFGSVHQVSSSVMDGEYAGSPLLLPTDEKPDLRDNEEGLVRTENVRWEDDSRGHVGGIEPGKREKRVIAPGRIRRAEKIALDMQMAANDMVKGADHVAYINREEKFASRGGCVYTAHHLPIWAADAKDFFQEADKNERINGSRYKEIEFALPNELSLEQHKEIIEKFISHHLKDFYYAYAVHEKIGALSDGEKHPHVHIMFSERKLDDYEKMCERPRGLFFKTASRIDSSTGGCKKDPKFNGKYRMRYLYEMRRDFADIQNEILHKHGFCVRVDHRSLQAQKEAAIERGDMVTASLLDRLPEKSVGPIAARNPLDKKVVALQEYRKIKEKIAQNAYLKELLDDSHVNVTAVNTISEAEHSINLLKEHHYLVNQAGYSVDNITNILKSKQSNLAKIYMSGLFADEALRRTFIKMMPASAAAKYDMMTELMDKKKNMKDFIQSYPVPEAPAEKAVYLQLHQSMTKQITESDEKIRALAQELKPVFRELASDSNQKIIRDEVMASLQANKNIKKKIAGSVQEMDYYNKKLAKIISDETAGLATKERVKLHTIGYSSRELLTYVYNQKNIINKRMDYLRQQMQAMRPNILSETAAYNIAMSIYTQGESKKLNQENRFLQKENARLMIASDELKSLSANKNGHEYKEKVSAYSERLAMYDQRMADYIWHKEKLESLCKQPHAINRINQIAVNILNKNSLEKMHYAALAKEYTSLKCDRDVCISYMKSLRKQVKEDARIKMSTGKTPRYSLAPSAPLPTSSRHNLAPKILSGVLAHDERLAKLVAYVHTDAATARFLASGKTKEDIEAELDQAD